MDTVNILGVNVSKIGMKDALNYAISLNKCIVCNVNADVVYQAYKNPEFLVKLNKADLLLAEDSLLFDASKKLHSELPERIRNTDFINNIIKYASSGKKSLYLLGGKSGIALKAKQKLEAKYRGINIVDCASTQYDEKKAADIIIIDLDSPIREDFLVEHKHNINAKFIIAFTGYLNYLAGLKKAVPNWYRKLRLEKLYENFSKFNGVDDIVFIPHFKNAVARQKKGQ